MEKYIIGKSITTLLRRPPLGVLKPFVLSSFFLSKHGAESPSMSMAAHVSIHISVIQVRTDQGLVVELDVPRSPDNQKTKHF